MNQETTSLSELPIQPGSVGGGGGGGGGEQNIVMTTNEKQSTNYSPNVPGVSDQQPQPNGARGPPQGGAPAPQEPQAAGGSQIPPQQMSHESMAQLNTQLQQAGQNNLTQLPTRDVPMNPLLHTQDEQTQPNHVPEERQPTDYIQQYANIEKAVNQGTENKNDFMENIYEEIQTPLLIFVLFFIFQLPSVSKGFNKQFPILLSNDSSLTLKGYIVKSLIVAILFFLIKKAVTHFSQ